MQEMQISNPTGNLKSNLVVINQGRVHAFVTVRHEDTLFGGRV